MTAPILLCTDGSDLAAEALASGLAVLAPEGPFVLVIAIPDVDASMVTGSGMAGGVMSADELETQVQEDREAAEGLLAAAAERLGLASAERRIVLGPAGPAICALAEEVSAGAVVIGSRGRGGLKRAVLGSVSDHVVRNAPCPVVVTGSR